MRACGLDFGTSNSAVGIVSKNGPILAPLENGCALLPSAVFFDEETPGRTLFGQEAINAYVGQTQGRLMRALKSILGSPLIDEKTALGHRRIALTEVVELFIRCLKIKAEEFAGCELDSVSHGRPVRFVDNDDAADRKAQSALEDIARRAGFRHISFVYEPIAAAFHYEEQTADEELALIADIGGGTSDFSVVRVGPARLGRADRASDILASAGVRIGGTDFDRLLSLNAVMPLLGMNSNLISKNLPMPNSLYFELATWPFINHAYGRNAERAVGELLADSRSPEAVGRLLETIRRRLGHRIAFGVEDAKIALSKREAAAIDLRFLEQGLSAPVDRSGFEDAIRERRARLTEVAERCISDVGLKARDIAAIFFTGGSSRAPTVRRAVSAAAPLARQAESSDFLSVALGLTREAERRYGRP